MSELKATTVYEAYWRATSNGDNSIIVYIKSEADKVIAEKDKEIAELEMKLARAQLVLRLNEPEALFSDLEIMGRLRHEIDVVARRERHQKYKRCLAMAKWCEAENYTACWYHENSERCEWTEKWQKRWLELAEKFKPNNSTAK